MTEQKEKAAFICTKDTLDGAYPSLVLGINAVRMGMETKVFYSFMGMNLVLKGGVERAKFFPPGVMGAIPGMATLATGMMKKKIAGWCGAAERGRSTRSRPGRRAVAAARDAPAGHSFPRWRST